MPLSKAQDVDPILTAFLNEYTNLEFIADQIFAPVKVDFEEGTYYTYTDFDRFRLPPTRRAPGAMYHRGELGRHTETYVTVEDGYEYPVDKRIQQTAMKPDDPYKRSAAVCADVIKLRREVNIINSILNPVVWAGAALTAALAGPTQWSDPNSNPVQEFHNRALTIALACGHYPNEIVMPWAVFLALKTHPEMMDLVKHTSDKIVTQELMKQAFGVDKFLVCKALFNSAEEGQAPVLQAVMGNEVFIGWINPRPALDAPSVGYLIQKESFVADSYYQDESRSDIVRARVNETPEIVSTPCGFRLTNVV